MKPQRRLPASEQFALEAEQATARSPSSRIAAGLRNVLYVTMLVGVGFVVLLMIVVSRERAAVDRAERAGTVSRTGESPQPKAQLKRSTPAPSSAANTSPNNRDPKRPPGNRDDYTWVDEYTRKDGTKVSAHWRKRSSGD